MKEPQLAPIIEGSHAMNSLMDPKLSICGSGCCPFAGTVESGTSRSLSNQIHMLKIENFTQKKGKYAYFAAMPKNIYT